MIIISQSLTPRAFTAIGLFYGPTESATTLTLQRTDVYRTAATRSYCLYTRFYCYAIEISLCNRAIVMQ